MAGVLTSDDLAAIAALLVATDGGVRLADGVAHGGSTASLELGSNDGATAPLYIHADSGYVAGVSLLGGDGGGPAAIFQGGSGGGPGIQSEGGGTADGADFFGGSGGGYGMFIGGNLASGLFLDGAPGGAIAHGLECSGGGDGGHGIYAYGAGGDSPGDGMKLTGTSGGYDLEANVHGTLDTVTDLTNNAAAADAAAAASASASAATSSAAAATSAASADSKATAIQAKTDNLPASPAAVGSAMTLTSGERTAIANALQDLVDGVESGLTPRQAQRVVLAALAGKASGLDGTSPKYRDTNDTKDRISATVDQYGNRSAVTLDAS